MAWRRLGQVFVPPGQNPHPALASHAALPVPYAMGGDLIRVFYSGRDRENRSSVGSVVLRIGETVRLEDVGATPILLPGGIGAFDDAGIGVGCVVPDPGGDRLYYMGWNVGGSAPWRNAIGMAIGDASTGQFERYSAGPLMDRDPVDPYSLSYPWVLRLAPDDWRMWYGTHRSWGAEQSDMSHAIRAARSSDGITWQRQTELAVPPEGQEIATVRPTVIGDPSSAFQMWFARRSLQGPYELGRAVSADGQIWRREDPGLLADPDGWEGGAVTYPAVFELLDRRWLLYNGSGYGATGFGLAVWEG